MQATGGKGGACRLGGARAAQSVPPGGALPSCPAAGPRAAQSAAAARSPAVRDGAGPIIITQILPRGFTGLHTHVSSDIF
jgi:hypothetical protein